MGSCLSQEGLDSLVKVDNCQLRCKSPSQTIHWNTLRQSCRRSVWHRQAPCEPQRCSQPLRHAPSTLLLWRLKANHHRRHLLVQFLTQRPRPLPPHEPLHPGNVPPLTLRRPRCHHPNAGRPSTPLRHHRIQGTHTGAARSLLRRIRKAEVRCRSRAVAHGAH